MVRPTQITFAGAFTVGEKKTDTHQRTIDDALVEMNHIGIVVNDIDFGRKLVFYTQFGFEGILRLYEQRRGRLCGRTQEMCEVPAREILETLVDKDLYDRAKEMCQRNGVSIVLNNPNYKAFLTTRVVPALIEQRLQEYELQRLDHDFTIYSERELRNIVSSRIQPKGKWRQTFEDIIVEDTSGKRTLLDEVKTHFGTPVCGGIMLALYEIVVEQRFYCAAELYPVADKATIENAHSLYERLHSVNSQKWPLQFVNTRYY